MPNRMQPMTENNEPIGWNDSLVLGYAPMDHMHEEFVRIIGRMQTGPDAELSAWLAQFIVHAQAHFEEENAWMTDTEFPPRACHMEQHQAVLNSAENSHKRSQTGFRTTQTIWIRHWRIGCSSGITVANLWCFANPKRLRSLSQTT